MPFDFKPARLSGLVVITPRQFSDERGLFFEAYKHSSFAEAGVSGAFVQDNESVSSQGVIRGLHYQLQPAAQGKLVRVVAGRIYDVAVDIRKSSPTCGQWEGFFLSAEEPTLLWIPAGFAHGFLALEPQTRVSYKCTAEYSPDHERSIRYDDPALGIEWPQVEGERFVSAKDRAAPLFAQAELFA